MATGLEARGVWPTCSGRRSAAGEPAADHTMCISTTFAPGPGWRSPPAIRPRRRALPTRGLDEAQSRALIGKSASSGAQARSTRRGTGRYAAGGRFGGAVWRVSRRRLGYRGDYQRSAAAAGSSRPATARVEALLDAGADLLACETLPSFAEIQALAALLQEYPAPVPGTPSRCVTPNAWRRRRCAR